MRDAWSSHEVWIYECLCCGATWDEEFDSWHVADGHGGEAVSYAHEGQACPTPWMDHPCKDCHSSNVKVFSAPWRRRDAVVPPQARESALAMLIHLRRIHAW